MKKDTSKSTILVISIGFLILYLAFSWKWAIIVTISIGIIGIISDYLSRLIEKGWMGLAQGVNKIIQPVLLSIVFYLILFPISILSRLFTKDPLMLSKKYQSYFVTLNKEIDTASFKKMW